MKKFLGEVLTISEIVAATYNIRHGMNMAGTLALDATAAILAQINPHIIALQEVDNFRPRSNHVNQSAYLANKLNMNYVFAAATRYGTGAYGNALLSKFPIKSSSNHFLPSLSEHRSCVETEIVLGGQILTVLNTHLGLASQERQRHLTEFILPLIKRQGQPAILSGDFNVSATAEEIKLVARHLQDTFKYNSGPLVNTFPASHPQYRPDYIFINSHCQCRNFYIVESQASDHLPAVAIISI